MGGGLLCGLRRGQSGQLQGGIVLDAWRGDPAGLDRSGDGVLQYVMLEGSPPPGRPACARVQRQDPDPAGVPRELANDTANWQRARPPPGCSSLEEFGGQIEASLPTTTTWPWEPSTPA